ncbi:MAG: metal-sulfur cluster assembly factor [Acetobacteraceae bacterium]
MTKTGSCFISTVDAASVRNALSEVTDPASGISIVDLGLIYEIEIDHRTIRVRMTMARPGSPVSGLLADEVRMVVAHSFPGHRVRVDVVWEPRWQPGMMSLLGRHQLQSMQAGRCDVVPAPSQETRWLERQRC